MLQNLENISPLPDQVLSFLRMLAAQEVIESLIIFGSRALGDYEKYSDLDLAIQAPAMSKYEWLKLREYVTYDLRTVLRISIVDYTSNPRKLRERINETGTLIYARQS